RGATGGRARDGLRADLDGASLGGADLGGAGLNGVGLNGAALDRGRPWARIAVSLDRAHHGDDVDTRADRGPPDQGGDDSCQRDPRVDLERSLRPHDRQRGRREPRAQRPAGPAARCERLSHHANGPALGQPVKFLSALGGRLRDGLRRSQEYLAGSLGTVLDTDRPVDDALLEELEEVLIAADLGAPLAADFINRAREEVVFGTVTRARQLRPLFRRFLLDTLSPASQALDLEHQPAVVLLLGVNGSGKTTTAAKLAASLKASGKRVILAAADTFRAAAIEQLERWGERIEVEVIRQAAGSDPGAVVFDAVKAATARSLDVLIVDTAGRLHTKTNL